MRQKFTLSKDHFSLSTAGQIKDLCAPLFSQYGIKTLSFAKLFRDGSMLSVHSEADYATHYLQVDCSPLPPIPLPYWQTQSFYYLPDTSMDENYIKLSNSSKEYFKDDNPVCILDQFTDRTEVTLFCSDLDDPDAMNRFFNSINEIKLCINYFKEATQELFAQGHDQRIFFPEHLSPFVPDYLGQDKFSPGYIEFNRRLSIKHNLDNMKNKRHTVLTERERECLYLLTRGYSYKDIANLLTISSRTVETHLVKAKIKLNARTKSELIGKLAAIINT